MGIQPKLSDKEIAELRTRWETPEGQSILGSIITTLRKDSRGWRHLVEALPTVSVKPAHPDLLTDLRGIDLRKVVLPGALIPFVDLSYASFDLCNLEGICLQGSKLSWATFFKCNLKRSDLLQVMADNSSFDNCFFFEAVMGDGDFRFSSFRNAEMPYVMLDGADLREASMDGVPLGGAKTLSTKFPDGFDLKQALAQYKKPSDDISPR